MVLPSKWRGLQPQSEHGRRAENQSQQMLRKIVRLTLRGGGWRNAAQVCRQKSGLGCLESFSKKFKQDVADERGDHGNCKIGSGKHISDCPSHAPLLPHAGALKFSHQKIGIKQEDDKTDLDQRPPNILLHSNIASLPETCHRTKSVFHAKRALISQPV